MQIKTTRFLFSLASLVILAGCASNNSNVTAYEEQFLKDPPTTAWLRENLQEFREKAWNEPTKENVEIFAFMVRELDKRDALEAKERNWYDQTHRLLTMAWGNTGRGGAALRQPAYIHVLANSHSVTMASTETTTDAPPLGTLVNPADMIAASLDKLTGSQTRRGYSLYELARWERYCEGGKQMDKADWAFVKKEGVENVPESLIPHCTPPK
ncbi:hypothetical protein GWQ43_19965 (plasmid) [Alcaligenes faecalis]|uniref:hypothetical protein n=1 Tax=Alcaligenes faecalis TaxID=511 RepID=UPI00137BF586|nr:hypothetical protein [Alcaligenes faecalis]QHS38446.1 hypothetical protein GWQ43_19965 [Alcaligenes faecalis]